MTRRRSRGQGGWGMGQRNRLPLRTAEEYDVHTGWRRVMFWRAGEVAAVKRRTRRRERRQARREARAARYEP